MSCLYMFERIKNTVIGGVVFNFYVNFASIGKLDRFKYLFGIMKMNFELQIFLTQYNIIKSGRITEVSLCWS